MPNDEIYTLTKRFVEQLNPLRVYLFGSYAYGTPNEESDYDFFIVVDDTKKNTHDQAVQAYRAIRHARSKPVDILVGTQSSFDTRKQSKYTIEHEINRKGILLYDAATRTTPAMA